MPRLLIDATPVVAESKGVGRYAYQVCSQLAVRLPEDWSLQIMIHEDACGLFPAEFRGQLVPVRKSSEIIHGIFDLGKYVKKLRSQILLKTNESAGLVTGIPTVTICHDIDELILRAQGMSRHLARRWMDDAKQYLRRRALQRSDFVICNSQFTRTSVHTFYGVPNQKTAVAYCAVDPRFYEISREANQEETRARYGVRDFILAFATGDPRENYACLPAVAARLREKQVPTCLLIAGTRPGAAYVADLRSRFQASGLTEGTHFVFEGFLGADRFRELAELYEAADFYLDLSLHEGFGMQLAEAMACGTTCIASPNGALAEIGGSYVVLVDPTSVDSISEAVKRSYENKLHLRNNQDQVAYTRKFSWDEMGRVVAGVLTGIAISGGESTA